MMHPVSVDGSKSVLDIDGEGNDLGASMVIGALLVIPVVFIFGVTLFLRLRKNGELLHVMFIVLIVWFCVYDLVDSLFR